MFFLGLTVVLLPVLLLVTCCSCFRLRWVRKLYVGEAAEAMLAYWTSRPCSTSDLPEDLQGVFWMSDNPAPEMIICMMGENFDLKTRTAVVQLGREYNWSYNNDMMGWLEYLAVMLLGFGSTLVFKFNEDFSSAEIPLMLLGIFDISWLTRTRFTMTRQAGKTNDWDRITYYKGELYPYGSYVARRVLDKDGNRLPAFDDMIKQVESGEKVKGTTVKTKVQLVQSGPSCFGLCSRRARQVAISSMEQSEGASPEASVATKSAEV